MIAAAVPSIYLMSGLLVCFSLAATLRCPGFTERQEFLLLIAPVFAFAIASILPIANLLWRRSLQECSKVYWLLVAEGAVFTALAIVDTISHRSNPSLATFSSMDEVVGMYH